MPIPIVHTNKYKYRLVPNAAINTDGIKLQYRLEAQKPFLLVFKRWVISVETITKEEAEKLLKHWKGE